MLVFSLANNNIASPHMYSTLNLLWVLCFYPDMTGCCKKNVAETGKTKNGD